MDAIGELQQTVDTFVTEYRRDRTVQNADNELTEAKSELEQSFGRYKEVRELAADIIFIVDSGYIRRSVIVDATERLAIRTPRYWLAPAVVAVAAWLKDDEGLYLDSISSALNLDPGKTALFMILLLRHQERAGAMREWIGRYLAGLEPTNLPTDFAVILEAVSGGTLAPGSAPQLARRMQEWYKNASSSRDVEAGEIGQWEQNLLTLAAAGNYEEEFPVLARSSPTWELLRKRHEANTAIEAADQYFRNRFGDGAEVPANLDGRISNLLKHLAEDPDAEEDQILRKIRRAEAVIDTRDDTVAQRRVAADEADRSRALNILSLVTRAAFPGGRRQAPTMTELLAIMLSKRFISEAAENTQNKHQRFDSVQITLGKRRGTYSCVTAAEVTPDALRRQAEDVAEELAGEIEVGVLAQSPSRSRGRRPHRRRPIDTGAAGKVAPVGPALRAVDAAADAQTATMLPRPFRIEDLETTRPWTVRENRRQIRSAVGGGTGANVVRRRPADVDLRRRTGTAAVNRGPVARWPRSRTELARRCGPLSRRSCASITCITGIMPAGGVVI